MQTLQCGPEKTHTNNNNAMRKQLQNSKPNTFNIVTKFATHTHSTYVMPIMPTGRYDKYRYYMCEVWPKGPVQSPTERAPRNLNLKPARKPHLKCGP